MRYFQRAVAVQTEDIPPDPDGEKTEKQARRISWQYATLLEPTSWGKHDRFAATRRVPLARSVSFCFVVTTVVSCLLFHRMGLEDLAFGRMSVGIIALVWLCVTFTEEFARDTKHACDGMSFLCFLCWGFSHIIWRLSSSEAPGAGADDGMEGFITVGAGNTTEETEGMMENFSPPWVWMDLALAWGMSPVVGAGMQLSLWVSIVPSWLCLTITVMYGVRAEEMAIVHDDAEHVGVLLVAIALGGVSIVGVGYQTLWEGAREIVEMIRLEDAFVGGEDKRKSSAFSEMVLRHLVAEPSLQVLETGIKELFGDRIISMMHCDALEQIDEGVKTLSEQNKRDFARIRFGAPDISIPSPEHADMENILDTCLRTAAYLAVSRYNNKVQLDLRVSDDVSKFVFTYPFWLSQMTRVSLIHALHPDEKTPVILRVFYIRPGMLKVGVEAVWRVARFDGDDEGRVNGAEAGGDKVLETAADERELPRLLSGWDNDMPAAAWWVRAAAVALGGQAEYSSVPERRSAHELWFTIPAQNAEDEEQEQEQEQEQEESGDAEGHPAPDVQVETVSLAGGSNAPAGEGQDGDPHEAARSSKGHKSRDDNVVRKGEQSQPKASSFTPRLPEEKEDNSAVLIQVAPGFWKIRQAQNVKPLKNDPEASHSSSSPSFASGAPDCRRVFEGVTARSGKEAPKQLHESQGPDAESGALKVLLVDPLGLLGWAVPQLREKQGRFHVTVARSPVIAIQWIVHGDFEVVVVDLHMPGMSGVDFCRMVRSYGLATGGDGPENQGHQQVGGRRRSAVGPARPVRLLLHASAPGSMRSDELEDFLEEGLVEQYMPQPLDVSTLMNFLEAFEKQDDDDLEAAENTADVSTAASSTPAGGNLATFLAGVGGVQSSNAQGCREGHYKTRGSSGPPFAVKKRMICWGQKEKPPTPCLDDPAAMFFDVKGLEGALYPEDQPLSHDVGIGPRNGVRTAGPWRPGPAAVVPVEFCRNVGGA